MNTPANPPESPSVFARLGKLSLRTLAPAAVLGFALGVGSSAFAVDSTIGGGWHHHGPMTEAQITSHVDHVLNHMYSELNVSDAQKAQIDPIVKQAISDFVAMHKQMGSAHAQALSVLSADTVDRGAIETLRAQRVAAMDAESKRMAQALGDIAEVLTPDQRKQLAAHIAKMHPQAAAQS